MYEVESGSPYKRGERCTLTAKKIRYWEFIPEMFRCGADVDHIPCPFAGPWYQGMRNLVACRALQRSTGEAKGGATAFLLVYAELLGVPFLPMAAKIRSPEWQSFLEKVRKDVVPFRTVSYLEMVRLAADHAEAWSRGILSRLERWLTRRIRQVSVENGKPSISRYMDSFLFP